MTAAPEPKLADAPAAGSGEPGDGEPFDVSRVADNLPFVLRRVVGITLVAVGANVTGVVVLTLIVLAMNATASTHQLTVVLTGTAVMLVASIVLGIAAVVAIQRRTLRWLLRGDRPTEQDTHRAIRMPLDLAIVTAVLWGVSCAVMTPLTAAVGETAQTVFGVAGGIVLAGLSSAGVTYLLIGRVFSRIQLLALQANPPRRSPMVSLRLRMLIIWLLTTGLPVLSLVLVITAPAGKTHLFGVSIVVAVVAFVVGGVSTILVARAVGKPLRGLAEASRRVGEGDLDVVVPVEDAGELGLAQSGFNDMVAGLRERDRVTDLFGRHVGSSVAREALRSGVTLSGESRDVVAVFVDITGSTRLSHERDPAEFVAMLNRFYGIVVDEVDRADGLLNKFEGDAALCVFGAPVVLGDPATAALRAARRIRDRVFATAEVEVGVGVAAGPVVAGQIGTQTRLEYTVIGDSVNAAARITELAKRVPGHLLAGADVVAAADAGEQQHWTPAGEQVLRGHDAPTPLAAG